ncbi:ester cyclase [soil metagenome]
MSATHEALVRRGIEEILNRGDMAVAREIFHDDFTFHTPVRAEPFRGPSGFVDYVSTIRTAFPDIRFTVEDLFSDTDRVVARWSARLTHTGDFFGIPPTGASATLTGIHVYRVTGDKIAEEWQELNALGLIQQLGVLPDVEKIPRPVLVGLVKLRRLARRR